MKSEWKTVKLEDVIDFNPKERLPKGTVAKKIGMEKLRPFTRDVIEYEEEPFSGGAKFRNGDTIMARITPCLENGKTAKINILRNGEVGFGSTEYIVMRAKPGITDPDYVYYLSCSDLIRDPAIKSMIGSSGRQRVQLDVVKKINIELPPLEIQKKIAFQLKSIDDLISQNEKININLEEQAKTVFQSWFVDFDPFEKRKQSAPNGYDYPEEFKLVKIESLHPVLETGKRPKGGAVQNGIPSISNSRPNYI